MCNALNHPSDCNCGFGGEWYGDRNSLSIEHLTQIKDVNCKFFEKGFSVTIPNAKCPVCGAEVFFYQNEFGSRVFFDELGVPWSKHPCTDNIINKVDNFHSIFFTPEIIENELITNLKNNKFRVFEDDFKLHMVNSNEDNPEIAYVINTFGQQFLFFPDENFIDRKYDWIISYLKCNLREIMIITERDEKWYLDTYSLNGSKYSFEITPKSKVEFEFKKYFVIDNDEILNVVIEKTENRNSRIEYLVYSKDYDYRFYVRQFDFIDVNIKNEIEILKKEYRIKFKERMNFVNRLRRRFNSINYSSEAGNNIYKKYFINEDRENYLRFYSEGVKKRLKQIDKIQNKTTLFRLEYSYLITI